MNNNSIIKAYISINKDMTCKGFNFEEGKEYEVKRPLVMGVNGFHAYTNPLDVFKYDIPMCSSIYFEVELSGDIIESKINCLVASKIKIGKRLDIIKDIIEPNLDYNTPVINIMNNYVIPEKYITIANAPGDISPEDSGFCKGVIGSYFILVDVYTFNTIAIKVDGERIKEDCCYRYYKGKIMEYNINGEINNYERNL